MVGAFHLAESRARNSHDTCLLDHVHAVLKVWLGSLLFALVDILLREVDPGEAVHGSLDLGACNLIHVVESILKEFGSRFETIEHELSLLMVAIDVFDGLLTVLGRVTHELYSHLSDCIGAELNRLELVPHLLGFLAEVVGLEVTSPEATLAKHAFGDRVH